MEIEICKIALDDSGAPSTSAPSPDPLEELEGLNLSYASLLAVPESGVTLARGRVEPGQAVPPHAAESRYLMLVLSGEGSLTLMREGQDEPDCEVAYRPGLLIDLPPHARHGWVNDGAEPFEWLGVDIAQ